MQLNDIKLAVVGIDYVGLPLAVEFGRVQPVVGFDINQKRIELKAGNDHKLGSYDTIIRAAAHRQFKYMDAAAIRALGKSPHVLYDLKYILAPNVADLRL